MAANITIGLATTSHNTGTTTTAIYDSITVGPVSGGGGGPPPGPLPSPWTSQDVGSTGITFDAYVFSSNSFRAAAPGGN